jgi:hypothetical protein
MITNLTEELNELYNLLNVQYLAPVINSPSG